MADSDRYRASSCGRYVMLPGGLALPIQPILLALELEERGFQITRDGSDLVVQPRRLLTLDDCCCIRRWKSHLLALVTHRNALGALEGWPPIRMSPSFERVGQPSWKSQPRSTHA